MWDVLRAELSYSRFAFLVFFATIPLLVMLNVMDGGGERAYVTFFVILMAVNYWNLKRISEKRDFHLVQLPLPAKDIGRARAAMIVLTAGAYLVIYGIIRGAAGGGGSDILDSVFMFSLIVTIYSALLIFRDKFVGTRSLIHGKILLVVILGILFGLGIYAMLITEEAAETGGEPPAFLRAFEYVIKHNPLGNPVFMLCFLAASLVLAYVSVITFQRRKTNIE